MPQRKPAPPSEEYRKRLAAELAQKRVLLEKDQASFSERVLEVLERGVTQRQLADAMDVHVKTVWRWAKRGIEARNQRLAANSDKPDKPGQNA